MVSFHPETIEKFKSNLPWLEQVRDERAEDVERARDRVVACERYLAEAEAMLVDQRRLIAHMEATNAEQAELAEARAQVEQAAENAPHDPATCPACVNKRTHGHTGFGVIPDLLSATPLAVAFGGAMAAPDFAAGNLVNISDPDHKRYGQRGSVVGYVYDPLGVVVEYDNLGNTVTVRPDQLMHHVAFVEQESRAEFAAEAASIPAQRDGEQADDRDAEMQATAWSATDQFEHDQACEAAIDAADAERWAAEDGGEF